MPTAYASILLTKEEVSFKDFALQCSRAFCAMSHMRNKPLDAEIEYPEVDQRYYRIRDKKMERLLEVKGMSEEDLAREADRYNTREQERWDRFQKRSTIYHARLEDMLEKARSWNPPEEYEDLKTFMIQQLEDSIELDSYEEEAPQVLTPQQWRERALEILENSIAHAERHIKRDEERVKSSRAWLEGLEEMLTPPDECPDATPG